MSKYKPDEDCCYRMMTNEVGGQSQPQPYWPDEDRNQYEMYRKAWNNSGCDQSGMKGK